MSMIIEDSNQPDPIEQEPTASEEQETAPIWQSDDKFKWYVVRVASSHENGVITLLHERAKHTDMTSYFDQVLMPTEDVVEMRAGKKRNSKRKFFPGYILVKMHLTDDSWHFVRQIPNVLGFLGTSQNKPMPISDKEAKAIIDKLTGLVDKPKSSAVFEAGEVVRIVDGPFADFNGVVEDVNYEKSRLVVAVLIFGRSTPVDLEFSQVEKGS